MKEKARILVVEDEGIVAENLATTISDMGYEVVGRAVSAEEAVKKALELEPDLILMDIVLKGNKNGIDASQEIKKKKDIPIIFLTAYSDISFIDKAKSIEPYAYIVKPFQPRQLLASIEMALYKSQMEKKLHEAQEWFSITLKSIGDCVIATDLKGNIKFMNTVAEAVTGWNMDEVGGKPVEVVFNIINEETGEPAEDPVTRVIREGTVAGLANHTLLITKDGTKIHIDDSGAPIRDDRGNIIGVVLVFYDITEQKRAEEELKISHKTYLGIINSLTEAIYIQDENGVFLEVNKAAEKFYGYPKEYFIGKTPELISAPGKNDIPMIAEAVKKAFNGESQSFEFWGLRKNGTIFPKSVNLTSGEYFGKKVVIATARDITERIRAKLELQVMYEITHGVNTTSNLDELLKLIHASLKKVIYAENCFVALHDQNTGLFSFPYFVDKFDPTPMPIAMRKSCTAYVFRTGKPLLLTQELFERLVEQNKVELVGTNSPSWLGVPLLTPSRTIGVLVFQHYEEENVYSEQDVEFLDSAGNQIAIAIERKRAEEAIQESQKNFMDLFDNAPIGYHEIDSEGRITRINSTELEMLGYTYDEMIGQPIWKYNSDEKLSYQAVQKKLSGKLIQTQAFERCLKRKDGTRVLVLIEEKILKDNAGKITGIRTTLQDITERKRAEEALRESEERFTAFMNNSPIVAWLKDPVTWTFCYINSAFEEVFDITQEVITRKTDFDLWPEEIARQLRENDLRVLSSDKAIQTSEDVPLPDGTVHHWLVFKFPLHTPSGKRFLAGTAVDITERKQAEDEIISQKNKFAQLFENSPIAIALLDDQGKIVQINESFSALFDYYHDEIKGKALNDIIVPPEFKEEAKSYSDQAREGNQINKESYRMRKDGAIVYVQIVGIPVIVNEKTVGIYGMYVDLTQRKNSEEALIIAKELAENAAELKSEFLAQMSHEIRTPLNIIASNSNLLKDELEEVIDTDLKSCFLSMEIASKRIIRTVDLILNMSQIQTGSIQISLQKIELVSRIVQPLIAEYINLAKSKNIELTFISHVDKAVVNCDDYCVTQIFANLIDNAIKFTPKGKVEVSLFNTDQGKLIFEIKDTGVGMYAEFIQNLFQPFSQEEQGYQRTFDGNGLGLALVKKYCELNDASIEVESKKNIGSTFRVIFNQ